MPLPNKVRAAGSGVANVSDNTVTVPLVAVGLKDGSKLAMSIMASLSILHVVVSCAFRGGCQSRITAQYGKAGKVDLKSSWRARRKKMEVGTVMLALRRDLAREHFTWCAASWPRRTLYLA